MQRARRPGFSLHELLVIIAIIGILIGLLVPAVQKVREAANRTQSMNNLKQLALANHNYHDTNGCFSPGVDENGFSAVAYLLPYLEQADLFKKLDFKKSISDAANAEARKVPLKVLSDPGDLPNLGVPDYAPTNYLFCAGSQASLEDNNGIFFRDSRVKIADITDGTSNTLFAGATLKGDGGKRAVSVQRQYVLLKDANALKSLKDESGVLDFENNKNIAGDRCTRWIDGGFLQGTFTGTRVGNDPRPDVSCDGKGGLSALRRDLLINLVGFADGSVRTVTTKLPLATWAALSTRSNAEVINLP